MDEGTIQIRFLNGIGGAGFAQALHVRPGTTVARFLEQQFPNKRATDLVIRVNRQPAYASTELREGDDVTVTPVKVAGAR